MYRARVLVAAILCGVLLQTTQAAAVVNADVDVDEDGTISFEEFLDFMEQYYENVSKNLYGHLIPRATGMHV